MNNSISRLGPVSGVLAVTIWVAYSASSCRAESRRHSDPAESTAAEASSPENASALLHGSVVNNEGEPVAGAVVRAVLPYLNQSVKAVTDRDGKFVLNCGDREKFEQASARTPEFEAKLVASAAELGSDFRNVTLAKLANTQLDFQLTKIVPITGHILGSNGQPLKEITITVESVGIPAGGIDAYIRSVKQNGSLLAATIADTWYGAGLADAETETDAEGRFTLNGYGANRIIQLSIGGKGRKWAESIYVVTRHRINRDSESGILDAQTKHYFANFVHRCQSDQPRRREPDFAQSPLAQEPPATPTAIPSATPQNTISRLDLGLAGPMMLRLQQIADEKDFVRESYRQLLGREPTEHEVEQYLDGSEKNRSGFLLALVIQSDRFRTTPIALLRGLRSWDLPPVDSRLAIVRLTRMPGRRTRAELVPSLLIYEDGTVVLPERLPTAAKVQQITGAELDALRKEIVDEHSFFELSTALMNEMEQLNRRVPDFDFQVNFWNSPTTEIWIRRDGEWKAVSSFLDAWKRAEEKGTLPERITKLIAIDRELQEVMIRVRDMDSQTEKDETHERSK